MSRTLLELHAETTPDPKLAHSEGMAVVLCGDSTVVFDREADARFFVEAHREVPAMLARVRELEEQVIALGRGALEARSRELDHEVQRRLIAEATLAKTQGELVREVELRTAAVGAARIGLQARARQRELLKQIEALEMALTLERNTRAR